MDCAFLRLPGRRVLVADIHHSPDGHGIGYGMMLIRMRRVLLVGRMLDVPVFFLPSRTALNTAVTQLESDDVEIVKPGTAAARALTLLWRLWTPFSVGAPLSWARSRVARVIVGPLYESIEQSSWLPNGLRRVLLGRQSLYRFLKRPIATYASRSHAAWHVQYKTHVVARVRALEKVGADPPPIRLRLPADREAEARRDAAALGIPLDRPLVAVHVRESGYRSTAGLRQRSWDDIRNARVESFFPAFNALVERGYVIVRLGDQTMTPVQIPGVVDLATAPGRRPWLDVWCTMRSEFLIGCDSGPSWLAVLLGVPVLTVNAVHFRDLSRPSDRIICKRARDRATGEVLSIAEMLTPEFLHSGFKSDRYEYLDNTPAELRRAVLDMIEVVHGRERRSSWQARFNRLLHTVSREKQRASSALEGVATVGRPRGTLSRTFARKYFMRREAAVGEAG